MALDLFLMGLALVTLAPQAIVIPQPPVIIPPGADAKLLGSGNDPDRIKILTEEAAFANDELRNSWHVVAQSSNKSVWMIRGKDFGAGSKERRSLWVKIDHSSDTLIKGRTSLELKVIDCESKSDGLKLTSIYDKEGEQLGHYIRPGPEQLSDTVTNSPGRAVVDAFCPK
jgi:hypothetical protein